MQCANGLSMIALLAVSSGCARESKGAGGSARGGGGGAPKSAVFPVEVASVSMRPVEVTVTAVGSIEAFEVVQITARVTGAIERIRFREGDRVEEGETLVEIEPERYRLSAEEARADLEMARAALAEADAGLTRRVGANEKTAGLIPGEELEAWRTRVVTARAEVASQEAAAELAARNARDARVSAPFAGTIQTRDVQTGQYVQPGALLSTLVRREPLLLRFQIPESDAARLSPGMNARFRVRGVEGEKTARLIHVAESADPTSRMVAATGEITERDAALRPGAFAEIVVPVGAARDAAVVPQTAVRPSERGFLAFVIEGGVAKERILSLGLRTPEGLVEVRQGLAPGESLVVRGAEALREGAAVRVEGAFVPDSTKAAS